MPEGAACSGDYLPPSSMTTQHFPIRFEPAYAGLSTALFILPSSSYVDVTDREVTVRMGWAFRARFDRAHVTAAAPSGKSVWLTRGVHGWAGRWLVNGAGDGILRIDLDPPQRGYVMGFPVRLRQLLVSVDDPYAVAAELTRRA